MALAIDHRPKKLSDLAGNASLKLSLGGILKRPLKEVPHALLFTGLSGGGKTTLGGIVANHIKCDASEIYEINSAHFKGIDTARELDRIMRYAPMSGSARVWIFNECFAKGTAINTDIGVIKIENIKVGDPVFSMFGVDKVKHKFENKVPLDRVVKIRTSDLEITYCSVDHKIFTTSGWVEAQHLTKNHFTFPFVWDIMCSINGQTTEVNNDNRTTMPNLQNNDALFGESTGEVQQGMLQSLVRGEEADGPTEISGRLSQQRIKCKKIRIEKEVLKQSCGCGSQKETFGTNDKKQSESRPDEHRKSQSHKAIERLVARLERFARWKRSNNNTTTIVGNGIRLGYGISDWFRKTRGWFSKSLHRGHSTTGIKDCDRSRWAESQIEIKFIEGYEKNKTAELVGVESVEIYKRGGNDEHFKSIITDTERDLGYVVFYDMEMENHPSYFANGMAVHNCHKMTNDAQNAMLDIVEKAPDYAFMIFTTTDPQKLIGPLRKRCVEYEVLPLNTDEMFAMLDNVLDKENADVPQDILEKIIDNSNGSCRDALILLEKVIDLDVKDMKTVSMKMETSEAVIKELIDVLLKKRPWKEVASVLKRLTDEPETIRYSVLGYCNAILMNGADNKQAALIMECFSKNTYDTGKSGITLAAYGVIC